MSRFVFMTGITSIPRRGSLGRFRSTKRWPASISRRERFVRLHPRSTNRSRFLGRSSFTATILESGESAESFRLRLGLQELAVYSCALMAKVSWSTQALAIVLTRATYCFCRPSWERVLPTQRYRHVAGNFSSQNFLGHETAHCFRLGRHAGRKQGLHRFRDGRCYSIISCNS
jgi:hypothetical protein